MLTIPDISAVIRDGRNNARCLGPRTRKFSYSSQVYLLMLSQFLHLFSLNEIVAILRSYGIAPPPDSGGVASGMPYRPGFEKMFLKSVG